MTEAEWDTCTDPRRMLAFLKQGPHAHERKLRLFGCACCRRLWHLLTREEVRAAVEVAERYADGLADVEELRRAWSAVRKALSVAPLRSRWEAALTAALHATTPSRFSPELATVPARAAACALGDDPREWGSFYSSENVGCPRERAAQCELLRDLFVPFRPAGADSSRPAWCGGAALKIARAIYQDRRFEELPILADALEEADCTDAALLDHLRRPGRHVRGCRALDLLLARG
jgi:hypothetical protein